jgi:hypothetical protein
MVQNTIYQLLHQKLVSVSYGMPLTNCRIQLTSLSRASWFRSDQTRHTCLHPSLSDPLRPWILELRCLPSRFGLEYGSEVWIDHSLGWWGRLHHVNSHILSQWFSGKIRACHARAPCSIHGCDIMFCQCISTFCFALYEGWSSRRDVHFVFLS